MNGGCILTEKTGDIKQHPDKAKKMKRLKSSGLLPCIICIAYLCASCASENEVLSITNLKCENLKNPNIIQQDHPRFSWHVESTVRADMQTAVQILVASSPDMLPDAPDLWNSGKVSSNENFLDYGGSELGSGMC